MRYFIRFSYFGKRYHGWQIQPNAITVQQVLEEALSTLLKAKLNVVGAGRTDAGVHAREMYAHFDMERDIQNENLVFRLNSFLPEDIAIQEIQMVKEEAHARFDANERTYEYWITKTKNPFYRETAYCVNKPINVAKMNEAAAYLLEVDDFESFSKVNTDVKTFLCDVRKAVWEYQEDRLVFTITADRFLRNMVRAVVGTLLQVGFEKIKPEEIKNIIASKDRSEAGFSAPAKGLYLTQVKYPENIFYEQGQRDRESIRL